MNNFCEDLVNGSNPRYTYSQPSINQQVSWQVQQEQAAKQAQFSATLQAHQARIDADKHDTPAARLLAAQLNPFGSR
jgi:hypothetical protein